MFIEKSRVYEYDRNGDQRASGLFLMLVMRRDENGACNENNVRAIVRHVTLKQFGAWMMGIARVRNERLTLSGTYGADGLVMDVSDNVYDAAIPLPADLYRAWANGGGHNSSGSESREMRLWARQHIAELYNVSTPRSKMLARVHAHI